MPRTWLGGSLRTPPCSSLGAGWCDFANNVRAQRVVAMDFDPTVQRAAAEHVTAVVGDCTDLSRFVDGEFNVVFASNLLEHLDRPTPSPAAAEAGECSPRRPADPAAAEFPAQSGPVLRRLHPCGHLHRSVAARLPDLRGLAVEDYPRFLPLTMKSRGSN